MNLLVNPSVQKPLTTTFTGRRQLNQVPEPLTKQIEMAAKEVESGKPSYAAAMLILNVLEKLHPELPNLLASNVNVATALQGMKEGCQGPITRRSTTLIG